MFIEQRLAVGGGRKPERQFIQLVDFINRRAREIVKHDRGLTATVFCNEVDAFVRGRPGCPVIRTREWHSGFNATLNRYAPNLRFGQLAYRIVKCLSVRWWV